MFSGNNGDFTAGGSEFLLQILNNPPTKEIYSSIGDYPSLGLTVDPAVAAVGPSTIILPQGSSNGGYFTPVVHSRPHSVFPTFPTLLLPHPMIVPLFIPQGCPPEHGFPREDGGIEAGISELVLRDDSVNPNSRKLVFGTIQPEPRDSFYCDACSGEREKCSASRTEECRNGRRPGRFGGQQFGFGRGNRVADEVASSSGHQYDFGQVLFGVDETAGRNATMKFNDSNIKDADREKLLFASNIRNHPNHFGYLSKMEKLDSFFYKIYGSLIPTKDEKEKRVKLLKYLGKVISKDFPKARLHLYGSCANSFDISRSDIDVCLEMKEDNCSGKSNILLKLAAILQVDNLQNVKALTHARVPVVKFFDPKTGISCDVCLNNMLAVVNTKLLLDYARIDPRLRQLVFIVKHWAKCRGVNETYKGTLSSYAYVLMCIHLLQRRRPAILPCLQQMKPTFSVWVNDVKCEYFDKVEELIGFGSGNRESIAELVTEFFNYWAHCHDYASSVISVRTGTILSKWEKKWTRRVGNDRHLICIEDPLEVTHDLGRVVDKFTITPLRREFIRAADILNNHHYLALFQPILP